MLAQHSQQPPPFDFGHSKCSYSLCDYQSVQKRQDPFRISPEGSKQKSQYNSKDFRTSVQNQSLP